MSALGGFQAPTRSPDRRLESDVETLAVRYARINYDTRYATPRQVAERDLLAYPISPRSMANDLVPTTIVDKNFEESISNIYAAPFQFRRAFGRTDPTCRTISLKPPDPWFRPVPPDPTAQGRERKDAKVRSPLSMAFAYPSSSPSPRPAGTGFNSAEAASPLVSPRRGLTSEGRVIREPAEVPGGCGGPWPIPALGWPVPPTRKLEALPPITCGVKICTKIYEAWEQCTDVANADAPTFLAFGYCHDSGDCREKLVVRGSGAGGYAGLLPHLDIYTVVYGAFKVLCEGAPRWVFLCLIGQHAGALVRDAAHAHRKEVQQQLDGVAHGVVLEESPTAPHDELQPERMRRRLTRELGGQVPLLRLLRLLPLL